MAGRCHCLGIHVGANVFAAIHRWTTSQGHAALVPLRSFRDCAPSAMSPPGGASPVTFCLYSSFPTGSNRGNVRLRCFVCANTHPSLHDFRIIAWSFQPYLIGNTTVKRLQDHWALPVPTPNGALPVHATVE